MAKGKWDKFKELFVAQDEALGFINVRSTAAAFQKSKEVANRFYLAKLGIPAPVAAELYQSCHNGQPIYTGTGRNSYRIYWPKALLTQEVMAALKEAQAA